MTRRSVRIITLIGCVTAPVLLVGGYYVWTRPVPQINAAACAKIQEGMTEKEVEGILGVRAGVYTAAFPLLGYDTMDDFLHIEGTAAKKHWEDRAGYINVYFDPQGKVLTARYSVKPGY